MKIATVLYGFFYCDCVWESGDYLQTLHQTKMGAYKAMRAQLLSDWEEALLNDIRTRAHFTRMKLKRPIGRAFKPLSNTRYCIKSVSVYE